eukprot:1146614-Pelagomonas_calceolata.AAC.5
MNGSELPSVCHPQSRILVCASRECTGYLGQDQCLDDGSGAEGWPTGWISCLFQFCQGEVMPPNCTALLQGLIDEAILACLQWARENTHSHTIHIACNISRHLVPTIQGVFWQHLDFV